MSLYPVKSIQKCSKCDDYFMYSSNTLDVPLDIKCDVCNNPYFKGYQSPKWFNLDETLKNEHYTLVIPVNEKPVKIIHNAYEVNVSTDNPMEFTISRKTTVGEMAANMDMSVEEFMMWLKN